MTTLLTAALFSVGISPTLLQSDVGLARDTVVVSNPRQEIRWDDVVRTWEQSDLPTSLQRADRGELEGAASIGDNIASTWRRDVLYADDDAGRIWVRGHNFRAVFDREGMVFLPVLGAAAPREYPVAMRLRSGSVGQSEFPVGVLGVSRVGDTVTLQHASLRERYVVGRDGVEQVFVFDELHELGELVLQIEVATSLAVVVRDEALAFVHERLGHVEYGRAVVYDASGRSANVVRRWDGDRIELRVPESFMTEAVMPVTVDPVISAWVATAPVDAMARPDVCYDGRQDQYWVAWAEATSATNSDCYVTSFDAAGVQGSTVAVEISNDSWKDPKLGFHYGANRLIVVARVDAPGVVARLRGQPVDCVARFRVDGQFNVSPATPPTVEHDVSGNNLNSLDNSSCGVVWTAQVAAGDRDVYFAGFRHTGLPGTPMRAIATGPGDSLHPAISESHGDSNLVGDWWTLAWTHDADGDGLGAIYARRLVWNASEVIGAGNFVVDAATNCAWPSVSSRLDLVHPTTSDRPSVVAYERALPSTNGPSGVQRDVLAAVVTDGMAFASINVSGALEDIDAELDQRCPSIATDGRGILLSYLEVAATAPAGNDYGVYSCTGHVVYTPTGAELALAERHVSLAGTLAPRHALRLTSAWDGRAGSLTDEAAAVWATPIGASGVQLEGAIVEIPTVAGSLELSIGRQFCDANPNGMSTLGSPVSSWISIVGAGSVSALLEARCVDVTLNATGYLLASQVPTDINLPGGSAGRLCVLGAGRFINAVQNSGQLGFLSTIVDPAALPTPIGVSTALPGETWCFQYWHRDIGATGATSNFSNAARVTFLP